MKSHRLKLGHLAAVLFLALFGPRRQCDRIASAAADAAGASDGSFDVEVIMPPRETLERDSYLCTRVALPEGRPEDATFSLVGFEPIAEKSKVHHMLLFGCQDGPSDRKDDVWDCKMRQVCSTNDVVLYGWGLNAPAVSLPTGSGYTIGARSSNRYLVLQIHFMDVRPLGDRSGLRLKLSSAPLENAVSLQAFARSFMVPPGRSSYPVSNECCYNSVFPMEAFASRVHTHALGRRVSLDVTTPSAAAHRLVVDSDPLEPQGFYPVNKTLTIFPGDRMEMTCNFDSSSKKTEVYAGATHEDEMCNLYLMASSPVASFSMCVMGSHLVKKGQGLGVHVSPTADTQHWDSAGNHVRKGFGQIPGLFYSNVHPDSVWMFYRRDGDWGTGSFDSKTDMLTKNAVVGEDTISLVDLRTGAVKRSLGAGMFMMPHMISEAEDGSLWVTDVGAHLVHKLSPDTGEILATLGGGPDHAPNTPGDEADRFCKPTEAIETRDGRVLVADGYCNNRVVEYDAKSLRVVKLHDLGREVPKAAKRTWRSYGTTLPHSLSYDECTKTAFVALRIPQMVVELDLNTRDGGDGGDGGRSYDLSRFGQPMAVRNGMYGSQYVLTMGERKTHLVELETSRRVTGGRGRPESRSWELEGPSFPHDFVFVPSPEYKDGSVERNVSFIVSETRQRPGSQTFKFIFHERGARDAQDVLDKQFSGGDSGIVNVNVADAAIHLNTDDLVVAGEAEYDSDDVPEVADVADDVVGDDEQTGTTATNMLNGELSDRWPTQRINVFAFSVGLFSFVAICFLQTLGITMRSLS